MNESNKWIKLHSKLLNWEWYKNANTMRLFIHLLLNANWKEGKFEGQIVPRGSLITGRKKLAEELNLSEQMIRTSLNNLKSTKEITIITTKKFSIITVVNYELYQQNNQVFNQQITNNQPTDNQQVTTIEEYKNTRIIDDIDISSSSNTPTRENLFEFIEKAFGRTFSSMEYERMSKWKDNDLTRYAIEITMLRGKTDLSFVEGVLRKFKENNITTLIQAKNFEEEYQRNKNKNKQKETNEEYIARRKREEKNEQK